MSSTLIIRLGPSPEQDASWLVTGPEGEAQGEEQRGPLADAAKYTNDRRVLALLPGIQTVVTSADIPVKGATKQLQVASFALEDQFAEDIGQMHFAVGARRDDGRIPVTAISLSVFQNWMDSLQELGIQANAIYSELQGLPDIPGTVTAIVEPGTVMLRLPSGESFAIDPAMLDTVLATASQVIAQTAGKDAGPAQTQVMIYLDRSLGDQREQWVEKIRSRFPEAEFREMAAGSLPQLAAGLLRKGLVNLLQGKFAPRSNWQRVIRRWRLPAMLAASLLVVVCLVQAATLWRLSSVEAQLDAALEVSLKQVFPGSARINDPRRQLDMLQQSLRGQSPGSSSQFLDTVVALGSILPTLKDTRVETASYRNQVLDLRLKVPDVTTLDQLQKRMQDGGHFQVTIQSANPRSDGVEGRIEIAGSGS
ncbi:MAG: type II secretion system protein GspL [Gammaproteobacteria bacterium]|nr:type II secretion system protein GspL [Gammaproteobacteria bacterium]